jgi:hypothetical protein
LAYFTIGNLYRYRLLLHVIGLTLGKLRFDLTILSRGNEKADLIVDSWHFGFVVTSAFGFVALEFSFVT